MKNEFNLDNLSFCGLDGIVAFYTFYSIGIILGIIIALFVFNFNKRKKIKKELEKQMIV